MGLVMLTFLEVTYDLCVLAQEKKAFTIAETPQQKRQEFRQSCGLCMRYLNRILKEPK